MNTEIFTGKAEVYAKARPGYPDAAIEYINSLGSQNAIFADIGAGTGKFAELIAQKGYTVLAVEPNTDMREQLTAALLPYKNAKIISGSAEATGLLDHSVDVITCAQALHWFDLEAFWKECRRIGKQDSIVIAIYNSTLDESNSHRKFSTEAFFTNPTMKEFPNPIFYTCESWLTYMTSHSHDPLPDDPRYAAHIAEMKAVFERENVDGFMRHDVVTRVYSERIVL